MSDLISREAAISALEDRRNQYLPDSPTWLQIQIDIHTIRALPAVQPDAAAIIRWHDMLLRDFGDDLSSIVRAEMLAMLDKPGKEVMPDVPNDAPNAPDAAPASTDDAGGGAEPTAVQTDAHVNETPKSEHEARDVLTPATKGAAHD